MTGTFSKCGCWFFLDRLFLRHPRSMNLWPSGCCKTEAWFFFEVGHWVGRLKSKNVCSHWKVAWFSCQVVHVLCASLLMSSHHPFERKPWDPVLEISCGLSKFHTVLGADSRVHCCYIGKHPSPSQSDQQDGYILVNGIPSWICSVASWVGDGGGIFSIINCHHTYTYNIRMYIYIYVLLFTYTYVPFCDHFRCRPPQKLAQDVYIAALEPLEMPSDARSFVIQVLTTSGPAPDALVVPVVDESYDVPWLVGGGHELGEFLRWFLELQMDSCSMMLCPSPRQCGVANEEWCN